jgi:hypothetical protein
MQRSDHYQRTLARQKNIQTKSVSLCDLFRYIPLLSSPAASYGTGHLPLTLNSLADRHQLPQQQPAAAYWAQAAPGLPAPGTYRTYCTAGQFCASVTF